MPSRDARIARLHRLLQRGHEHTLTLRAERDAAMAQQQGFAGVSWIVVSVTLLNQRHQHAGA